MEVVIYPIPLLFFISLFNTKFSGLLGSKNKMLIVRIVNYRNYQNIYDIITDQ